MTPETIDENTLPTTVDDIPYIHSHVTESRSGAALDIGDEFIVLFHDRVVHAEVTEIETEGDG